MYNFFVETTSNLTKETLQSICLLKDKHWKYGIENQLEWIANNIKDNDEHIMMFKQKVLVGYLNCITVQLLIDDNLYSGIGVGNVCVAEKHSGFGEKLINYANTIIIEKRSVGLLFCKESLLGFYKKCNWQALAENIFYLNGNTIDHKAMIFNYYKNLNRLDYRGKLF